jgi:hypothetical protein
MSFDYQGTSRSLFSQVEWFQQLEIFLQETVCVDVRSTYTNLPHPPSERRQGWLYFTTTSHLQLTAHLDTLSEQFLFGGTMNIKLLNSIEDNLIDLVAKITPWCAPLPTAYLIDRATVQHLHWPGIIGLIAAAVIESLGLVTTATALDLYQHNRRKRKIDPSAPFGLSATLVALYFFVATSLTVLLDIFPFLSTYAPAIFPALSLVGVTVIALRSNHRDMIRKIQQEKSERRPEKVAIDHQKSKTVSNFDRVDTNQKRLQEARRAKQEARMEALLLIFKEKPDSTILQATQSTGLSRQTIYSYLDQLEKNGRLRRNGHGIEVLK